MNDVVRDFGDARGPTLRAVQEAEPFSQNPVHGFAEQSMGGDSEATFPEAPSPARLVDKIADEARLLLNSYLHEEQVRLTESKQKIPHALDFITRVFEEEEADRLEYIRGLSARKKVTAEREVGRASSEERDVLQRDGFVAVSFSRFSRLRDISLEALDKLCLAAEDVISPVQMPRVLQLPKYDAWVPVSNNFFVTEADLGHFVPYFGDTKKKMDIAHEVSELMRQDTSSALDMDSERESSDEEGKKPKPKPPRYFSIGSTMKRAAMRRVLINITSRFGQEDDVWRALSIAMQVPKALLRDYIFSVAQGRDEEEKAIREQKEKGRRQMRQIREAIFSPHKRLGIAGKSGDSYAAAPLQYFCFACHEFGCHYHEGENVPPVVPIPDDFADTRLFMLRCDEESVGPCSGYCYLLEKWKQSPPRFEEGRPWTSEDEDLLLEAAKVFEVDPCHIAWVIGTKTCREVYVKVSQAGMARHLEEIVRASRAPRPEPPNISSSSESEEHEPITQKPNVSKGTSRKSVPPITQKRKPKSSGDDERFIPCNHYGPCRRESKCSCAMRGLDCESRCGCKYGRYAEGDTGIVKDDSKDIDTWAELRLQCKRRTSCDCKTGYCNTDGCLCFKRRKACNPDACDSCGCSALPSNRSVRDRRCRNSNIITSTHKQTFVGRSEVHGYGLFAGERFRDGDLVGQYAGRVMETDLVDKALRISQARHETFAFKLDEEYTVDGGLLGSKVKFINHTEGDAINCVARCERVRGEARIGLKACQSVAPGEEFLFNYEILAESDEGNEWVTGGSVLEGTKTNTRSRTKSSRKAEGATDSNAPEQIDLTQDPDFDVSRDPETPEDVFGWD